MHVLSVESIFKAEEKALMLTHTHLNKITMFLSIYMMKKSIVCLIITRSLIKSCQILK